MLQKYLQTGIQGAFLQDTKGLSLKTSAFPFGDAERPSL